MTIRTVATFIGHVRIEAIRLRAILVIGFVGCITGTILFTPFSATPLTSLILGGLATITLPATLYIFSLGLVSTIKWLIGPPVEMSEEEALDVVQFHRPKK